jgi:hypothetical protein
MGGSWALGERRTLRLGLDQGHVADGAASRPTPPASPPYARGCRPWPPSPSPCHRARRVQPKWARAIAYGGRVADARDRVVGWVAVKAHGRSCAWDRAHAWAGPSGGRGGMGFDCSWGEAGRRRHGRKWADAAWRLRLALAWLGLSRPTRTGGAQWGLGVGGAVGSGGGGRTCRTLGAEACLLRSLREALRAPTRRHPSPPGSCTSRAMRKAGAPAAVRRGTALRVRSLRLLSAVDEKGPASG